MPVGAGESGHTELELRDWSPSQFSFFQVVLQDSNQSEFYKTLSDMENIMRAVMEGVGC